MARNAQVPAARVVALLCIAEIASMAGTVAYPALLPVLVHAWDMSNSTAGLVSGSFFAGYLVAVPLLTSLTDRVDARRIYVFATLLAAGGTLGFGWLAHGPATGILFQTIAGAGLAGTYMPGLKILSDHIEVSRQSRFIAFYTSSFGIGTSLSLVAAGALATALDWRVAFMILAAGPAMAGLLVIVALPRRSPPPLAARPPLFDFRGLLKDHAVASYVIAYAAHCWELIGVRSWMVAFLAFSASLSAGHGPVFGAAAAAAAVNLLGPLASIFGNELAAAHGRRRVIARVMTVSALLAGAIGFTAPLPWILVFLLLCVYFLFVMGDSAALTAGLIAAAPPQRRGAAMALHSFIGFGAGFLAPVVFGVMLDVAGGNTKVVAWGLAFASLGLGVAAGPLAFVWYRARGITDNRGARGS